jgi:hypothetical protein
LKVDVIGEILKVGILPDRLQRVTTSQPAAKKTIKDMTTYLYSASRGLGLGPQTLACIHFDVFAVTPKENPQGRKIHAGFTLVHTH